MARTKCAEVDIDGTAIHLTETNAIKAIRWTELITIINTKSVEEKQRNRLISWAGGNILNASARHNAPTTGQTIDIHSNEELDPFIVWTDGTIELV